jgi:hypothetical protein
LPLESIFTFLAMIIVVAVVIRGRKKVRCLEAQLAVQRPISEVRKEAEGRYNESRIAHVADYCRELEAKVQNRSLLLELLIDDADARIEKLLSSNSSIKSKGWILGSPEFKEAFIKSVEAGHSDAELALEFKRHPLAMGLLRDLWRKSE